MLWEVIAHTECESAGGALGSGLWWLFRWALLLAGLGVTSLIQHP